VHPGEVLKEELTDLGMSANAFAKALGVPTNRVTAILRGTRGVTADTALRLARYFGTSPRLWVNLQQSHDLKVAEGRSGKDIAAAVKPRATSVAPGHILKNVAIDWRGST
jgi:addiction module HigA family antidote